MGGDCILLCFWFPAVAAFSGAELLGSGMSSILKQPMGSRLAL